MLNAAYRRQCSPHNKAHKSFNPADRFGNRPAAVGRDATNNRGIGAGSLKVIVAFLPMSWTSWLSHPQRQVAAT
jgi:hypothetical protein